MEVSVTRGYRGGNFISGKSGRQASSQRKPDYFGDLLFCYKASFFHASFQKVVELLMNTGDCLIPALNILRFTWRLADVTR